MTQDGFTCSFRDAIRENGTNLFLRTAAFLKTREIPIYALGRGDAMQKVSEAYVRFLLSLAAGEKSERLVELLNDADGRLENAYEKRRENDNRQH